MDREPQIRRKIKHHLRTTSGLTSLWFAIFSNFIIEINDFSSK